MIIEKVTPLSSSPTAFCWTISPTCNFAVLMASASPGNRSSTNGTPVLPGRAAQIGVSISMGQRRSSNSYSPSCSMSMAQNPLSRAFWRTCRWLYMPSFPCQLCAVSVVGFSWWDPIAISLYSPNRREMSVHQVSYASRSVCTMSGWCSAMSYFCSGSRLWSYSSYCGARHVPVCDESPAVGHGGKVFVFFWVVNLLLMYE